MLLWMAFGDQWKLNQKVTFDGANRTILVSDSIESIDVATDIYDAYYAWADLYNNVQFPKAVTKIEDYYFLMYDWTIEIDRYSTDLVGYLNPGDMIRAIRGANGMAAWNYDKTKVPVY